MDVLDQTQLLDFVKAKCGEDCQAAVMMTLGKDNQLMTLIGGGEGANPITLSFMSKSLDAMVMSMLQGAAYPIAPPKPPGPNLSVVKDGVTEKDP